MRQLGRKVFRVNGAHCPAGGGRLLPTEIAQLLHQHSQYCKVFLRPLRRGKGASIDDSHQVLFINQFAHLILPGIAMWLSLSLSCR